MKYPTKSTPDNQYYVIYRFMRALDISHIAKEVYALIYAFTNGEYGLFFGTRQFIADTVGCSIKSVYRSISKLTELGLIEKCELDGCPGLRTTELKSTKKRKSKKAPPPEEKKEPTPTDNSLNGEVAEGGNKPAETFCFTKKHTIPLAAASHRASAQPTSLSTDQTRCTAEAEYDGIAAQYAKGKFPKYVQRDYGRHGLVGMTKDQHDKLLSLVGSELLTAYIRRLEMLIEKSDKTGIRPRSPYRTIKKWIEADLGT